MKIHSSVAKIVIFSLVFIFFVLPPLFSKPDILAFSEWKFPFLQALLFALSLFLLFSHKELWKKPLNCGKFFIFYDLIFPATFTVCILFSISFFLNGIALLLKVSGPDYRISLPQNILQWCFCLLTFIFAASFEEILYRFYIPDFLINISGNRRIFVILIEAFTALLFAFAHFYGGVFAVINALLAHAVLRLCYKKTGFIACGLAAHFIYNLIQLFLLEL